MIKQINKLLKLVGLNLVHAKRKAPKSEAKRVKEFVEEFLGGPRPPYTREELESTPLKCAVNQPGTVPLSDYQGECEWQNTPKTGNEGRTHYVGDDCPGGHKDCFKSLTRPPLEVGVEDHEMTRVEQPNSNNNITGPTA